jgi:phage baseplate assembly protein W
MSGDDIRALDVPFHLAGSGRAATTGEDDHIRDMIFSVLFTSPGERVNRPDFGCGLKTLIFSPASQAVAAATQVLVKGSLQKWLENEIKVESVDVSIVDSSIVVKVVYIKRTNGERITAELEANA